MDRDLVIKDFKPVPYWNIIAILEAEQQRFKAKWHPAKKDRDEEGRCIKNEIAIQVQQQIQDSLATVPMLTPNNVISLPKGQAFALIEGGQLYKLRLPLPDGNDDLPEDIDAIAQDMKKHYLGSTPENWFDVQDHGWFRKLALPGEKSSEVKHG